MFTGFLVELDAGLLAAEDDPLKEIDMVLPLAVILDNRECVFEYQLTKSHEVMSFPVLYSFFEIIHRQFVLTLPGSLIDGVGDPCD